MSEEWDFSIYEEEQENEDVVESLSKLSRPNVTGLKSRFSNGEKELEKLSDIGRIISKYSIQVESRTQDMPVLWKYYGALSEYWENVRNIYGSTVNDEVRDIKKKCRTLLEQHNSGTISPSVHNNLLYFRSVIYRLRQLGNLGFEVERTSKSIFSRAKRKIVEG